MADSSAPAAGPPAQEAAARDNWNDGMGARSTAGMSVREVREMDPSKTSIYTQGVLVRDGMAPAAESGAVPIQGNGLNDLLKWSIGNSSGADLQALRERVARGEYDPSAYREYLDAMMGEPDLARMRTHLKTLLDEASDAEARVGALEEIEFLAESIDNANDLLKVGGLKTVVSCLGQEDARVAGAAASAIATCTQNNPTCQAAALAANLVHTLLAGLIGDDDRQKASARPRERGPARARACARPLPSRCPVRLIRALPPLPSRAQALAAPFLSALSASVRGHAPSARALLDAGGVALLAQLARRADAKARRRALFLLATLAREAEGVARALREQGEGGEGGAAGAVLDGLAQDDVELQAQALSLIGSSLQGEAVGGAEREACREMWVSAGVTSALQELAQRLQLRLANGDQSEDDDPAVPLRIVKLLALLDPAQPLGEPPAPPAPPGQLPTLAEGGAAEGEEGEEEGAAGAAPPAAAPPPPVLALM